MRTFLLVAVLFAIPALAQTPGVPRVLYDDITNQYWALGNEDGSMIGSSGADVGNAANIGNGNANANASNINNRSGLGDGTNPGQGGEHYDNGGTYNPGGSGTGGRR